MDVIRRFLMQESRYYRNFQVIYFLLFVYFVLCFYIYVFEPLYAQKIFSDVNQLFGGYPYYFPEDQSLFYRVISASSAMSTAGICLFLQWNIRDHIAAVVPLLLLQVSAAGLWLLAFVQRPLLWATLAMSIMDIVVGLLMVVVAVYAYKETRLRVDDEVIPRLRISLSSGLDSWGTGA